MDKDDRLTITLETGGESISFETSAHIEQLDLADTVIRLRNCLLGYEEDTLSNHFNANKETIENFSNFNNDYIAHYNRDNSFV